MDVKTLINMAGAGIDERLSADGYVASHLGVSPLTVAGWRKINHIPWTHRPRFLTLINGQYPHITRQDIDNACTGREDKNL